MLVFDLRPVVFGVLVLVVVAVASTVWVQRRRGRQQGPGADPADTAIAALKSVLDRAPFGVLVLQGRQRYRYANPHARQLLSLSSDTGTLPDEPWVHDLAEDRVAARLEESTGGRYRSVTLPSAEPTPGSGTENEAIAKPVDKGKMSSAPPRRVVRWWVTPWGPSDLAFLWDVTAQRQAEEASRLLLSSLAHELHTPLGTILTHVEVLRLPNLTEEQAGQSLHLLREETRRLTRLVDQMLELGRLETTVELERRPVHLVPLVEEVMAQVQPRAEEKGMSLSLESDTPLPPVLGDPDRLRQVFLNLLDNAVTYCGPGDRVVVSLQKTSAGVACVVRDTGPGIPAEHLPHVTRRFYRAAPQKVSGSGLGLALVAEILRRHESRVGIESWTEGEKRGTRVAFVLREVR